MFVTERDDNWQAQLRKGWLELAVLASLWDGRLYGLEILRRLEENSNLVVAEGTVYPVLNRLRADRLVASEWVESDSGHPRKYYALTAAGRRRSVAMARHSADFLQTMLGLIRPLLEEKS